MLTDINLEVAPGEVVAVVGANGAGKTTFMELLEGLLRPDRGSVRVLDEDPVRFSASRRSRIGVFLQQPGLPLRLTAREVLRLFAACYADSRPVEELIERFGLGGVGPTQIRKLSEGQQRRVSLALAFLSPFDVIFLDEPTSSIDVHGRQTLWDEVRSASDRGAAIVLTSHIMDDVAAFSDRVLVLAGGHGVACDRPGALVANFPWPEKVEIDGDAGMTRADLERLPAGTSVVTRGRTTTIYCLNAAEVRSFLIERGRVCRLSGGAVSVDDVIRMLTSSTPESSR